MVLLLDFLAEPHTTTPYAQSGCIKVLYNNILMLNVRFERRSGLSRWSHEFNFLRLFLRWADHVSRLSNIKPRYFTSFEWGIIILFIVTGGQSWGLREKVIKEDFVSFIFILHLTNHWERMSMCVCNWRLAVVWSVVVERIAVSSA